MFRSLILLVSVLCFVFIPSIICIFEGCFVCVSFYHVLSSFTLIFCCCVSRSWFGVHDPCGGGVHSPGRHPYRPRLVPSLAFCLRLSSRSVFRSWILTTFQMGSLSTRSGLRWLISPRPHSAEPHGLCSAIGFVGVALSFP